MVPNWCENKLMVKGESRELVEFVMDYADDEGRISVSRLFGENRFDCDRILKENIGEITFWFDTKWGPSPGIDFLDEINEGYPNLDAELFYFSAESAFWGYYSSDDSEFFEVGDNEDLASKFFEFGVKEGFLIPDSNGKYDFTRQTPTSRLLL